MRWNGRRSWVGLRGGLGGRFGGGLGLNSLLPFLLLLEGGGRLNAKFNLLPDVLAGKNRCGVVLLVLYLHRTGGAGAQELRRRKDSGGGGR